VKVDINDKICALVTIDRRYTVDRAMNLYTSYIAAGRGREYTSKFRLGILHELISLGNAVIVAPKDTLGTNESGEGQ
jgi:hypothetical protein